MKDLDREDGFDDLSEVWNSCALKSTGMYRGKGKPHGIARVTAGLRQS